MLPFTVSWKVPFCKSRFTLELMDAPPLLRSMWLPTVNFTSPRNPKELFFLYFLWSNIWTVMTLVGKTALKKENGSRKCDESTTP